MVELWKASHFESVEEWQEMQTPLYLKIWWGAWLVSLRLHIESSGQMEKNWAIFFTCGFLLQETAWLVSSILALRFVKDIKALHEKKAMMISSIE